MTNIIVGTSGNDNLIGTIQDDIFDLSQGGEDTAIGLDGNDVFQMGAAFDAGDHLNGWTGNDTVTLDGDYSAGLVLGVNTLTSIERISVAAGHSYNLTSNDNNVAAGATLAVDASQLAATDLLTFDGSAETDGHFSFVGGSGTLVATGGGEADSFQGGTGNDNFNGGGGNDTFDLSTGGSDTVNGGDGDDTFNFGASLDASDNVDGGAGNDTLIIHDGANASLVTIRLTSVEELTIPIVHHAEADQTYNLAIDDGDDKLLVDARFVHSYDTFDVTWGADTLADEQTSYVFKVGAGSYTLDGANQNDGFDVDIVERRPGSVYVENGNGGNDAFNFRCTFSEDDRIDGGSGVDTLYLRAGSPQALVFNPDTIVSIENIKLYSGTFNFTTDDANVAAGATLKIDGHLLSGSLDFDGSAETDGKFSILGSPGNDTIFGGAGNDVIKGGGGDNVFDGEGGADALVLSGGTDLLIYRSAADSTSTAFDVVTGFDGSADRFDPFVRITGVDMTVTSGTLSRNGFDAHLASAVNGAALEANHAVLFTPSAGGYHGQTFLVIDQNGVAGYQSGQDLVIELSNSTNLASFGLSNFV
jgi:Ca2+-binding RTX toxin-like protein